MKQYCLALDLKDDPEMIAEYEEHHRRVSPVILASIRDSGIERMQLFRAGNRMFMIMEVRDDFSFEEKDRMDKANPDVQEWESLMWKYQEALPFAGPGEKWVLMKEIFDTRTD
ncbi:MAG: L-rhamnose mutarotase [Bacteroidota bacterium]|nr:L-rhamnose mutarotase [Bacteroidota bacterium]